MPSLIRHLLSAFLFSLFLTAPVCLAQDSLVAEKIPEDLTIQVDSEPSDQNIAKRLNSIFKQIEDLSQITVKVSSGVVTLSGMVPDSLSSEEATTLTRKTSGVIYVRNQLEENVEVSARLSPAAEKAQEMGAAFLKKLPIFGIALLIVMVAWMSGNWISHRKLWLHKMGLNDLTSALLRRIIRLAILAIGIFIALEILDATALAGAILGIAGVAGVALGFAFRNIVENYLAGILLSMRNPFSSGDAIEIDGLQGKVVRLTSRDTVLMTFDGNHLRVPNSKMITTSMTNFSRNPLRRFDFAVGVSVELDLIAVRDLALETLTSVDSVLEDPAPIIVIEELGDSTVNMRFFAWIDQRNSDFLKSKSEAIRRVKDAFDDADIEMPEPIYRVHLRQAGLPPAVETLAEQIPSEPKVKKARSQKNMDTSADNSIDKQVEKAQREEPESNLLDK